MKVKVSNILLFTLITGGIAYLIYERRKVSLYAKKFLGQDELPGNTGFKSGWLEAKMKSVGWKVGEPWCMYLVKIIWLDKYPEIKDYIKKLITGSTQTSFNNILKSKSDLLSIRAYPEVGDIAIWQYHDKNGNPKWTGHGAVVVKVNGEKFQTVEGNTNETGSREGYTVAEKIHNIDEYDKVSGLKLKGFIHYNYAT